MEADDPLRRLLVDGAREFNAGRYFEAHEVLEDGLESVPDALWDLVVGLIQIAVGYHKAGQGLWSGAAQMLRRGLEKTAPFADLDAGLKLAALQERVRADAELLRMRRFDPEAFARRPPRLQLLV